MEGISEPAPNVKLGRLLDAASNASLWSRESLDLTRGERVVVRTTDEDATMAYASED
jgi:hypothetical protein